MRSDVKVKVRGTPVNEERVPSEAGTEVDRRWKCKGSSPVLPRDGNP